MMVHVALKAWKECHMTYLHSFDSTSNSTFNFIYF